MKTKTERENFNWRVLLLMYTLFLVIAAGIKLCLSPFDTDKPIDIFWFLENAYWLLINPLLLASIFTHNFRKASITIGDFYSIPDFQSKLILHVEKFSVEKVKSTDSEFQYLPTIKFRRWFRNWFETERLTISFSTDMIKITGPNYRISSLDDILQWNKDFKI